MIPGTGMCSPGIWIIGWKYVIHQFSDTFYHAKKESFLMRSLCCGMTLLFVVTSMSLAADHTKDSLPTVKKGLAEKKAVLVDVRELDEWNDGHLKEAKHLALSQIKTGISDNKLKEILPPGKIIYLHCAAGGRCLKAADMLKNKGYDLRPLKPGYDALISAGFEKAP